MNDKIEEVVSVLETAISERDWELIIEAIRLLNEIPNGNLPSFDDEEDNYNSELE